MSITRLHPWPSKIRSTIHKASNSPKLEIDQSSIGPLSILPVRKFAESKGAVVCNLPRRNRIFEVIGFSAAGTAFLSAAYGSSVVCRDASIHEMQASDPIKGLMLFMKYPGTITFFTAAFFGVVSIIYKAFFLPIEKDLLPEILNQINTGRLNPRGLKYSKETRQYLLENDCDHQLIDKIEKYLIQDVVKSSPQFFPEVTGEQWLNEPDSAIVYFKILMGQLTNYGHLSRSGYANFKKNNQTGMTAREYEKACQGVMSDKVNENLFHQATLVGQLDSDHWPYDVKDADVNMVRVKIDAGQLLPDGRFSLQGIKNFEENRLEVFSKEKLEDRFRQIVLEHPEVFPQPVIPPTELLVRPELKAFNKTEYEEFCKRGKLISSPRRNKLRLLELVVKAEDAGEDLDLKDLPQKLNLNYQTVKDVYNYLCKNGWISNNLRPASQSVLIAIKSSVLKEE